MHPAARQSSSVTPRDTDKGTLAIDFVHEALRVARQRGLDLAPMLRAAGLGPELMDSPRARVSASTYARLWSALADTLDDEFFGLDHHPMRRGSFRLLCHAVLDCETLGQALRRMLDFLRLVLDDLHATLEHDGPRAVITLHDGGTPRRMFAYATFMMIVHGLSCWLVGRRLMLRSADFRSPAPPPLQARDYRIRFCESARFDQPLTCIAFDAAALELPLVQSVQTLPDFLRAAPANLLVRYRDEQGLAARVRGRLRSMPPSHWESVAALAASLQMSVATLQRRLLAEGSSCQAIKDELRRDLAIHTLEQTRLPLTTLAERLGYAELSVFHRAFKKWTGVSPGAYRAASSPASPD